MYIGNDFKGYGNLIIIKHKGSYLSVYAHNNKILVKKLQEVSAGQKISIMGDTDANYAKLYFEIFYKGKSVNPLKYLSQKLK